MAELRVARDIKTSVVEVLSDSDGGISLRVGCWYVLRITPQGKVRLASCIGKDNSAGLQVDSNGRILIEEN